MSPSRDCAGVVTALEVQQRTPRRDHLPSQKSTTARTAPPPLVPDSKRATIPKEPTAPAPPIPAAGAAGAGAGAGAGAVAVAGAGAGAGAGA
eukprot:CAMPEP_0119383132 /NCGR_PEP_ID=MMETSP1334-20130426/77252_1 /TAXON_ID=127549 /ORGANISM="Calcidiscus leptoporus, Strain RCC1130" /LENGTH=91 /DNA_ID=CAMNT_0007403843 /DNA_START=149 /DNA_END=420 /DNA_ORIENTATION=+